MLTKRDLDEIRRIVREEVAELLRDSQITNATAGNAPTDPPAEVPLSYPFGKVPRPDEHEDIWISALVSSWFAWQEERPGGERWKHDVDIGYHSRSLAKARVAGDQNAIRYEERKLARLTRIGPVKHSERPGARNRNALGKGKRTKR